ncbi:hypothetical protein REC12_17765 [Desulfosporosinus sp. PR]|uniref:hypothetical protein n=1 Tax=Candidatus Desulfosporosinus nitrosoreducens TaxID=3401928 RepID=UPI0027F837B3|nr:hypothetical protein [Desulfosporosinus sp. PR]MDQ7095441.1 hypothetical protein [Desulfosporosinus sp. PR]
MKKIITFILALCMVASSASLAFATDSELLSKAGSVNTGYINQTDIPKVDMTPQNTSKTSSISQPNIATYYYVCAVQWARTDSKLFSQYLTSSWANASSYTWSQAVATAWSLGGSTTIDVTNAIKAQVVATLTRTTTYTVAITLPADATRLSKLGFFSDFTEKYVYTEKRFPLGGSAYRVDASYYNNVYEPLANTYLMVVYN